MSGEDDIGNLKNTLGAGVPSPNHGLGVVEVEERVTSSGDDRPGFTNDLSTRWDSGGVGDKVGTCVEEDDLATRVLYVNSDLAFFGHKEYEWLR